MNVNDDYHPDDLEAHAVIKKVCGIPADTKLTNSRALNAILRKPDSFWKTHSISDAEDKIISDFLKKVAK
jgi:hypothetical protein